MDRRVTPLRRVTSPTWGPSPPCKQALGQTPCNTTRDAFMNKYVCARELIFGLCVNAFYVSTTARRVTSPTKGPPPPCKQALCVRSGVCTWVIELFPEWLV